MNQPAPQQDIDSGTGEVITPGAPVDHVDVVDGASVGHSIEPPADVHEPGHVVSEKPDAVSRDDIYSNAAAVRDGETNEALAGMNDAEKAHYHRMVAEAQGVTEEGEDPFDGEGNVKQGWVPEGTAAIPAVVDGQPAAVVAPVALDNNSETTTIIVYGMKQEVPTAEVNAAGGIANYQKVVAADEKMKRASTYEASVRAYDQEVQNRAAHLAAPQATGPAADPELPPTGAQDETVDVQSAAERLVGAMYTGDREAAITEAAEVLTSFKDDVTRSARSVIAQAGAQAPDLAEQQAAQQRDAAQTRERTDANQVFVDEFRDLSSPVLRNATYAMVQEVAAESIMYGRPLAEITREAGMRVRADVFGSDYQPPGEPAPAAAVVQPQSVNLPIQAAPTDLAGRMALKSRTVVQPLIPSGGARFSDAPTGEQKTESNSEYVARMKRDSRGQGV